MSNKERYINQDYMDLINVVAEKHMKMLRKSSLTPALITTILSLLDKKGLITKEEIVTELEKDLDSWSKFYGDK